MLVVEDDPATSRFMVRVLERAGHEVTAVGDAHLASEELSRGRWDVLLVDIGLPGKSGFDLVAEVQASHPELPVALTTADASMDVAVRALRSEVDDFLAKPIAPEALLAQVERLLERGRRKSSRRSVERVLAIGAHPDDVEIGVGGALLVHRDVGDETAVLTMSRGARGGDQLERAAEATRAAELLGATLFLEEMADTEIPMGHPTVGIIESVVQEFEPTIIYTHSLNDNHQDHRNVCRAVTVAARQVPNLYCFESPSATIDFHPRRFVAIDRFIDHKLAVIDAYRSQVEVRSYLEPDLVRSTSRYWGRFGDSRYCEPLEVVRERSRLRSTVEVGPDAALSVDGQPGG